MRQTGPDEVMQWVKRIELILDKAHSDKARIIADHPLWNSGSDARVTALSKLINVLNSVHLALTFVSKHLLHPIWWATVAREEIPQRDMKRYVEEFLSFVKIGFIQFLVLSVESTCRILMREIEPGFGEGGFQKIYRELLKNRLSITPSDGVELLDLLQLVRNTVHNNGVYFAFNQKDVQLTYKGMTYDFCHGSPVDFANWDLLFDLVDDLRVLIAQLVTDSAVVGLGNDIQDPFWDGD